jgi:hypothetical protein
VNPTELARILEQHRPGSRVVCLLRERTIAAAADDDDGDSDFADALRGELSSARTATGPVDPFERALLDLEHALAFAGRPFPWIERPFAEVRAAIIGNVCVDTRDDSQLLAPARAAELVAPFLDCFAPDARGFWRAHEHRLGASGFEPCFALADTRRLGLLCLLDPYRLRD